MSSDSSLYIHNKILVDILSTWCYTNDTERAKTIIILGHKGSNRLAGDGRGECAKVLGLVSTYIESKCEQFAFTYLNKNYSHLGLVSTYQLAILAMLVVTNL